jgi:adenosylcobinamide-GDP ribazoletransferase
VTARLPPALRGARAAFIFLTRIPLGGFPFSQGDWQWSSGYFPFVGAVLGLMHAAVFRAFEPAGAYVAGGVTIAIGMLLTGAFHEDGLADTADALGGTYDRKRMFEILKDSRVGSFGAGALCSALMLKLALFGRLDHVSAAAMVFTQCASRTPPIWLMAAIPYVTGDAESKSKLVTRATWKQALLATGWPVLMGAFLHRLGAVPIQVFGAMAASVLLLTGVCAWRFIKRAGGITGDFLGACQQVNEIGLLLAWALVLGTQGG